MHTIIAVDKPKGKTPLEVIKQIKKQKPELTHIPITYAGRLDPLAHGVLLLLAGEQVKKKNDYLSLPKIYEFEVVFGIETDTYDLLGYVDKTNVKQIDNVNIIVNTFVNNHIGKQLQMYPPYSSKPVNGKPLFWWAKNNRLDEIILPEKEIEIFSFSCISTGEKVITDLKQQVEKAIASVDGNFRQEEIKKRWEEIFSQDKNTPFKLQTAKFLLTCSSGTYVRELIHQMGKELGTGAVALDILRTSIGDFTLEKAEKLQI